MGLRVGLLWWLCGVNLEGLSMACLRVVCVVLRAAWSYISGLCRATYIGLWGCFLGACFDGCVGLI